MATKLFLRTSAVHKHDKAGRLDMLITAGAATVERAVATAASGTEIQWTDGNGGVAMEWISPPLAAGFILATTDTMTFNIWAREDNMNANIGGRARVFKWTASSGSLTELPGGPYNDGVEFGTVDAAMNWTGVVTSNQTFSKGDRIVVRYYITNIGTMAAGFNGILSFNGPTAAADGDSWFQLNNNVTFESEVFSSVGSKWGVQPVGEIRRGHPLAPDFAWFFQHANSKKNARIPDAGGRSPAKVNPNAIGGNDNIPTAIKTAHGIRLRSGYDHIDLGPQGRLLHATQNTVVFGAKWSGIREPVAFEYWFSFRTSALSNQDIQFRRENSTDNVSFTVTTVNAFGVGGLSLTKESVWVLTWGPRGIEVWQNGVRVDHNVSVPGALTADYTRNVRFGALVEGSAPGGDDIDLAFCYIYKGKQLTPAQIREISARPF